MSRFTITDLPLKGLKAVSRKHIGDERGFITRLFCGDELAVGGWTKPIAQINHAYTAKRGTVRGVHFQTPPWSEMKLVNCIRGVIFDVAVDLRVNSSTYLKWYGIELSPKNGTSLLIPEGFGHAFQALTEDVEIIYFHSAKYNPEYEAGLNPGDPSLDIRWPIEITEISQKDKAQQMINSSFKGIVLK